MSLPETLKPRPEVDGGNKPGHDEIRKLIETEGKTVPELWAVVVAPGDADQMVMEILAIAIGRRAAGILVIGGEAEPGRLLARSADILRRTGRE